MYDVCIVRNIPDNEYPALAYSVPVVSEQKPSGHSTHINNLCLILNLQIKLAGIVLKIFDLKGNCDQLATSVTLLP